MKCVQLLKEEILGNLAIVYHRGNASKLDRLLNKTYENQSHIDFDKYNQALYTTTDVASQLNQVGNRNNMKRIYGDYIIKLAFKGISNCWFCNYSQYSKYNNCTIDNWKEQQFNKFNIPTKDRKYLSGEHGRKYTANHSAVSKYFEKYNLLSNRIKGIQYWGPNDGNCLLIYDWTTAVPIAFSKDECKTWEKIDKNKTQFSRNNFKNNDYIDTNKKINNFPVDMYGNVNCSDNKLTSLRGVPREVDGSFGCSGNKLTTLQGAPKEVGGGFYCTNNQLTNLQGAPEKVGGDFYCYNNKLTSLQGAPKEVGGEFDCSDNELTTLQGAPEKVGSYFNCSRNQLTKQEIVKYLKTAKIGGKIYTDFGTFNSQQEAIKKLSRQLNENKYFNY